jgi:hypothetical protein
VPLRERRRNSALRPSRRQSKSQQLKKMDGQQGERKLQTAEENSSRIVEGYVTFD